MADTGTTSTSLNLVFWKVSLSFLVSLSTKATRFSAGSRSVLLSTTSIELQTIWPMTRHSAVWVCMPLVASTTSTIRSMICAPPMMVLMREAWPGQSTRVTCSFGKPASRIWGQASFASNFPKSKLYRN